jgi:hypothetical protein
MRNLDVKKILFLTVVLFYNAIYAQPVLPQRKITLEATQELSFGRFHTRANGGTISVSWQGIISTTGDVFAMPRSEGMPAIYAVKLCQGRNIKITYPQTSELTNSNGDKLRLDIGPTEKGASGAVFASEQNCNFITILRVGATLHIPPNTTIGDYTGGFSVSFDQQ